MKNLISIIKSDNYLMLMAIGAIIAFVGMVTMLCKMFAEVMMCIFLVLGVAFIIGGLTTVIVFLSMSIVEYKVDEETNDDKIFFHE